MVAVCVGVCLLGAIALTLKSEEEYASTAALLLRPSSAFEPQRVVETNLQLTELPALSYQTAKQIPGMSGEEVEKAITSSQQGEADIIQIKATTNDPDKAAEIANVFAEEFITFRETEQERGPEGELAAKVQLVERAEPETSPVSPSTTRNLIFGGLIGLALGIGLALMLEQLDRRVKRQDDLPEVTGLPLLATVPKREAFDEKHLGRGSLSPAEAEIFLMLRANLRYFNVRKDIRSVLVTSAGPGEGKTMISLGLALGATMSGERVLLIEGDMRDPSLGRALRVGDAPGLSWLLSDPDAELSQAIATVPAREIAEIAGDATLDVLPSGRIPPNPTELIESKRMRELLAKAQSEYDFVVIDTPPILLVADAIPLVPMVSGVLAVSGLGVSTRTSANDLAEQLERMEAPTLGLVANFATNTGRSYDGYGYGRPPERLTSQQPPAKK
ncbi:MAG: tyrosine-protein kinase [Solirubrobacterales bacterium]|nr:tyrosine-protein kinase [Solirubrobacterales bacterium]